MKSSGEGHDHFTQSNEVSTGGLDWSYQQAGRYPVFGLKLSLPVSLPLRAEDVAPGWSLRSLGLTRRTARKWQDDSSWNVPPQVTMFGRHGVPPTGSDRSQASSSGIQRAFHDTVEMPRQLLRAQVVGGGHR